MDEFFSTLSVTLLVLGRPDHSSSSTDISQAFKHKGLSKTASHLEECSPKSLTKHFKFLVSDLLSFMKNVMQTCFSVLLKNVTCVMDSPLQFMVVS
jgi:hypothetical protein